MSACCSCRGPKFGFQYPYSTQSSECCRPCVHTVYIHTLRSVCINYIDILKTKVVAFPLVGFFLNYITCVYCAHVCRFTHMPQPMLRSEDNWWESVLFIRHVGPGNPTQVIRLDVKCCYQMNHLDDLLTFNTVLCFEA